MGASTRAAAFTALRCGYRPYCVDYFADRDLAAVCPVQRVDPGNASLGFERCSPDFSRPPGRERIETSPWFYTGGFENEPDLVDRISRRHRLWGVGAEVLRAVRDPIAVARALNEAGIPVPEVRRDPRGLPRDGSWLVKPIASGGGRGIEPLTDRYQTIPPSVPHYFQRRVDGPSFSALFIGRGGRARLIGITRQWVGIANAPFAYRGSLGPCPIAPALAERLQVLGDRLAGAFSLVGWFGVDYVLRDDIPWPVEINPRYTASIEIHELATGRSLMDEHRRACEGEADPGDRAEFPGSGDSPIIAKRILYAPRPMTIPEGFDADWTHDRFEVPPIADIPAPGTRIQPGEPVMTVFATAPDLSTCCARLNRHERSWIERLWGFPIPDSKFQMGFF